MLNTPKWCVDIFLKIMHLFHRKARTKHIPKEWHPVSPSPNLSLPPLYTCLQLYPISLLGEEAEHDCTNKRTNPKREDGLIEERQ